jgi:hypothetical protein
MHALDVRLIVTEDEVQATVLPQTHERSLNAWTECLQEQGQNFALLKVLGYRRPMKFYLICVYTCRILV